MTIRVSAVFSFAALFLSHILLQYTWLHAGWWS